MTNPYRFCGIILLTVNVISTSTNPSLDTSKMNYDKYVTLK